MRRFSYARTICWYAIIKINFYKICMMSNLWRRTFNHQFIRSRKCITIFFSSSKYFIIMHDKWIAYTHTIINLYMWWSQAQNIFVHSRTYIYSKIIVFQNRGDPPDIFVYSQKCIIVWPQPQKSNYTFHLSLSLFRVL